MVETVDSVLHHSEINAIISQINIMDLSGIHIVTLILFILQNKIYLKRFCAQGLGIQGNCWFFNLMVLKVFSYRSLRVSKTLQGVCEGSYFCNNIKTLFTFLWCWLLHSCCKNQFAFCKSKTRTLAQTKGSAAKCASCHCVLHRHTL